MPPAADVRPYDGWSCRVQAVPDRSISLASVRREPPASSKKSNAKYEVFILAGQSNMGGRGGIIRTRKLDGSVERVWDQVLPPECCPPSGSVLAFTADNCWEEAQEPLHTGIDRAWCGVGPGMPFASSLLSRGCESTICLIPCALGSSEIDRWLPGRDLFDRMVSRTQQALQQLPQASLCGMLWFQGESDSYKTELSAVYAAKLCVVFEAFRLAFADPSLPIVQVAIGCTNLAKCVGLQEVRHAQLSVKDRRVATVDAQGLALQEDGIHLATESQVSLGTKMAAAYWELTQTETHLEKET